MPDRTKLKIGDRIRLLCVPNLDLEQRERELRAGMADAGWTANTIEQILACDPVVTISSLEDDMPWFEYELPADPGEIAHHFIAVMDDDSWELC